MINYLNDSKSGSIRFFNIRIPPNIKCLYKPICNNKILICTINTNIIESGSYSQNVVVGAWEFESFSTLALFAI